MNLLQLRANNGSDYFGTSADTPFWNWSTGIVMFLGRYLPIGLMLVIAGSFTIKDRKEVVEPIKTQGVIFISVLVVVTFLLTASDLLSVFGDRTIFDMTGVTGMWTRMQSRLMKHDSGKGFLSGINSRVIHDSLTKLNPIYLAHYNPVMFTVEVGFFLVLFIALFPSISSEFVGQNQIFYFESAIILIITVWFATFSESLSEAQARARVDSLRSLEKEVMAHKLTNGNGKMVDIKSTLLKPGDEVKVYAGEIIPRDGLVCEGKAFVDESMMTGESNPVFKEKGDHVIGGTKVASDNMIVEITAEAGRSFLDQMIGLIQNATRPKTQNEIALTILLAGLSLIFITVISTLLFLAYFLGYKVDIATLVALLVALMPTTIGALLPAIGVAGITRLGRDNIVAKSGKGIEAAGDCDVLILDKTGTITEGSRSAIKFIPLEKYSEIDVGQAALCSFNP